MTVGRAMMLPPRLFRAAAAGTRGVVPGWRRGNGSFARRAGKAVEPAEWEKQRQPDEATSIPAPGEAEQKEAVVEARDTAAGETKGEAGKALPEVPGEAALEAVYHMGAPAEKVEPQQQQQRQQQEPTRYIHHFDSYSLVKQLQEGGYTNDQAITAMKAIRGLLARNLDVAQETLVSKSDVENESYLFSAACSELSAEIKNNRRVQDEQMRQQRTHLQHEVDILTQSLSQELLTLNDNVRGLFNDRRMAVREEQKTADSAIQQINYKMSIMLSSDSKSEIEGVRWILIRRSVVGIIFMAILTLGTIRYATYVRQERERRREDRMEHEDAR